MASGRTIDRAYARQPQTPRPRQPAMNVWTKKLEYVETPKHHEVMSMGGSACEPGAIEATEQEIEAIATWGANSLPSLLGAKADPRGGCRQRAKANQVNVCAQGSSLNH